MTARGKTAPKRENQQTIRTYIALRKVMAQSGTRAGILTTRKGLPAAILVSFARHYHITLKHAYRLAGVSTATADRKIRLRENLALAVSERLTRIAQIEAEAIDVLGNEVTARRWLDTPNAMLGGEPPLEMVDTGHGAEAVRRLLGAIRYGGAA
jgi:putative toxin-antitoxin system antitoxin component (TIGR02293 family)